MRKLALVVVVTALGVSEESYATSFDIPKGATSSTVEALAAGETGTVEQGGALSITSGKKVNVTANGSSTLTNSGTISQTGTGRAVQDEAENGTFTVTNNAGAHITSAQNDAIQFDVDTGNITIYNFGTINAQGTSGTGQAIDLNGVTSGTNAIYNYAGGLIEATGADSVRPGVNGYIFNAGTIVSYNETGNNSGNDGIDAKTNSGVTIVNTGVINGARHGITGGNTSIAANNGAYTMSITNSGTIEGQDGSGINIDGINGNEVVTVINNGLITGNGVTGDGDGIDIDGLLNLVNTGTIKSIQALNDTSEGLSIGGGTIVNSGLIEGDNINNGASRGISLVGNDNGTSVRDGLYGNALVTNSGTIRGQTGAGIGVTGAATAFTATINNLAGGSIEGGGSEAAVFSTYQALNVVNAGTITADTSGVAISLGSGKGSVRILGGAASVNGNIDGGTGGSALTITPGTGNSFTYDDAISNFATVDIGAGTVTLNGLNDYAGTTAIDNGATLIVGDASHASATIGSGLTTVSAGGTLSGYGTVLGSVVNAGTIAVASASPGSTSNAEGASVGPTIGNAFGDSFGNASGNSFGRLTIDGNYTGAGGTVLLNASGASADRLIINGNASGSTAVAVNSHNTNATIGDGIELIQVNGTTAANSFHLASPVQGGAYQYLTYQGSATDASNVYLRSSFAASGPSANAAVAYRPGVAGYTMMPSLNLDYGFTILGQRSERAGEAGGTASVQRDKNNGIWARLDGQNLDADSMNRFSADQRTFFAQFGKDWKVSGQNDDTHAGLMVTLGSTSTKFADKDRGLAALATSTGTAETHAQSLGGYWTRTLANGLYFDGVGQLTHYQNQYGDVYGDTGDQNGFGVGASGEIGRPWALGATSIAIEPQVQLLYQYLHLNGFNDAVSAISGNATNALRARIGFKIRRADISNGYGHGASTPGSSYATPYFTADLVRDLLTPGETRIGSSAFDNGLSRTQYDVGAGISFSMGKYSSLYASVKYARNIGGEYRQEVLGLAGYRLGW